MSIMRVRTEAGWVQCNRQNTHFCTAKSVLAVPTHKPIQAGADGVYDWDFRTVSVGPWQPRIPIGATEPTMTWTAGQGYTGEGTTMPGGQLLTPGLHYNRATAPGAYPKDFPHVPLRWRIEWEVDISTVLHGNGTYTVKLQQSSQTLYGPSETGSGPQTTYVDLDPIWNNNLDLVASGAGGQVLSNKTYYFHVRSIAIVPADTNVPVPWHVVGLPAVWDGSRWIDDWEYR